MLKNIGETLFNWIPMNINELKLLLSLSGNKRLQQNEEEIFADKDLTRIYLQRMSIYRLQHHNWYPVNLEDETDNLLNANWYINETLSWAVYWYAIHVIKGRWREAEKIISQHNYYRNTYNEEFDTQL